MLERLDDGLELSDASREGSRFAFRGDETPLLGHVSTLELGDPLHRSVQTALEVLGPLLPEVALDRQRPVEIGRRRVAAARLLRRSWP